MSEVKKRRTNGFGSGFADILVVVNKPHDEKFVAAGWTVHSETEETTTFEYSCRNRYSGDDETVVFTLYGQLPEGIESENFKIDWDNSVC